MPLLRSLNAPRRTVEAQAIHVSQSDRMCSKAACWNHALGQRIKTVHLRRKLRQQIQAARPDLTSKTAL